MTEESPETLYRAPTIYDVAKAAGVAPSTVSRAFARPGRVNAVTAQRVRQAAEQLGYRTNPLARATSTGRTSMIAVMISDITNPFYFGIIRGAQAAAAEVGYTMLLADAQESDVLEREALERALPTVEGIVLASTQNVGLCHPRGRQTEADDGAEPGGRRRAQPDHRQPRWSAHGG